jgi:hypothetical protein
MNNTDKIWYENINNFITSKNYFEILPSSTMSLESKLNALTRLSIYISIILALIKIDYTYLFIGIIALILSVIIYNFQNKQRLSNERFMDKNNIEVIDNKVCLRSTVNNPFMNPSLTDYSANYDKCNIGACDLTNPKVSQSIENNFNSKLFRDVSDLYGKMSSQRQYYTMPVTTIPNDQTGFAEWLYKAPPTCKEGNSQECHMNLYRKIGA